MGKYTASQSKGVEFAPVENFHFLGRHQRAPRQTVESHHLFTAHFMAGELLKVLLGDALLLIGGIDDLVVGVEGKFPRPWDA